MHGVEQPGLEVSPQVVIRENPLAIDLVFQRRFLEGLRPCVVIKHLQQIVGAEIAGLRFRRMRDLEIGLDALDVAGPD